MERLTYYLMKGSENDGYYLNAGVSQIDAINALAAYENTGLTPEEINTLVKSKSNSIDLHKCD